MKANLRILRCVSVLEWMNTLIYLCFLTCIFSLCTLYPSPTLFSVLMAGPCANPNHSTVVESRLY